MSVYFRTLACSTLCTRRAVTHQELSTFLSLAELKTNAHQAIVYTRNFARAEEALAALDAHKQRRLRGAGRRAGSVQPDTAAEQERLDECVALLRALVQRRLLGELTYRPSMCLVQFWIQLWLHKNIILYVRRGVHCTVSFCHAYQLVHKHGAF